MNHNRKPLTSRTRKKLAKEVRVAQSEYAKKELPPQSNELKVDQVIQRYPKKLAKTDKSIVESMKKNFEVKKKKSVKHHSKGASVGRSKRTTPGQLMGQDAAPAHVHTENERWQHQTVVQSVNRGQALKRKLSKKK